VAAGLPPAQTLNRNFGVSSIPAPAGNRNSVSRKEARVQRRKKPDPKINGL